MIKRCIYVLLNFFLYKKNVFRSMYRKSPFYFKRNYDNTDFITIELFTIGCCTFFRIFLFSEDSLVPDIVLSVNISFLALELASHLVSGSCQRNPIISLSWDQNFFSCSGESDIHASFWRCLSSWEKSAIGRSNIKYYEYSKAAKLFNIK